jgi:hypothetical protein
MAEEHSGAGEFKGSGDFTAALTDVVKAFDGIEVQASVPAYLREKLRKFFEELGKRSADFMGKAAELKREDTQIREDINLNLGLVDIAQRDIDTARADLKQMRDLFLAMHRRMRELEAAIRELKSEPPRRAE